ncbi:hypothetical protein ADIS_0534 [Lunatimonas lonarensis]|uniref:DUF4174 domain-containing protein n=1 Tax=Lunatimonas lonarensis TaxID=1232681 RepID=R7ZXQ9_9BACT|nr:DUF4174 domain-containing protein [Lunatimonas lonarensis]EON78941.1 hypothetical protein ADIS_0534 [Lunatimonas lonarensis]
MKGFGLVVFLLVLYADTITLEDLRWKHRVLFVFPPEEQPDSFFWEVSDSLLVSFSERDLLYFVFEDSVLSNSDYTFEPLYREFLRKKYVLGSKDLCWVLIGKDGGSKMRREGSLPDWDELFGVIDAMPMRVREMGRMVGS